jgi:multidrug efflux pump subunit AcrB
LIIVPALIYQGVKNSKFQMFQPFDASSINITFKAKPTTTLEESLEIVQTLEKDILKQKDRFFVKHVSSQRQDIEEVQPALLKCILM